jgi:hypothetical protein
MQKSFLFHGNSTQSQTIKQQLSTTLSTYDSFDDFYLKNLNSLHELIDLEETKRKLLINLNCLNFQQKSCSIQYKKYLEKLADFHQEKIEKTKQEEFSFPLEINTSNFIEPKKHFEASYVSQSTQFSNLKKSLTQIDQKMLLIENFEVKVDEYDCEGCEGNEFLVEEKFQEKRILIEKKKKLMKKLEEIWKTIEARLFEERKLRRRLKELNEIAVGMVKEKKVEVNGRVC